MNRLWVRLSIAFAGVVMLGVAVIMIASAIIARNGIREAIMLDEFQTKGGLVDYLQSYYAKHRSWDDLITSLTGANADFAIGPHLGLRLLITDNQGIALYDSSPSISQQDNINVSDFPYNLPLRVDNQTRGYIILTESPQIPVDLRPSQARFVVESLSTVLLIIGLAGGIIGLFFGVLVSRSLTAPLQRLSDAARAVGARNLSQRVKVEGTDEVKDMANAFNEMAAALEQTEALRRNMVADVAHELRTPLTVLQGNLLAILDEVYPMDNAEVARLYDQTRLLGRLVDDLHELSQADANQLTLNLHPVQLDELVHTTVAKFESLAEADGIKLNVDMAPDLPIIIADSGRLSQILHNLLNNALVHTLKGGQITIRTTYTKETLSLQVKDTGDGIPPESLPYVFNRFYRVDSSRNRNTGGTGLGLAIVKALVEAHGGTIGVTSEGKPGLGSSFTVDFPRQQPAPIPA